MPDDGRLLELAPHAGLPLVYVESNLETWHFPKMGPGAYESPQFDSDLMVATDLESRGIQLEETGIPSSGTSPWVPKKVTQVSFPSQSRDLEKGIGIAFKRPAWEEDFWYYLELGFDMEFRPVPILHIGNFRLAKPHWRSSQVSYATLPVCKSFWSQICGGSHRVESDEGFHSFQERYKLISAGVRAWPPLTKGPYRELEYQYLPHHGDPYLWNGKGDRTTGLEICIDDMLPQSYGCVKLKLSFRPLRGLKWQLTVQEERLHPESSYDRDVCFKRLSITGRKVRKALQRGVMWVVFYKLLPMVLTFVSCMLIMVPSGVSWLPDMLHISGVQFIYLVIFIILPSAVLTLFLLPSTGLFWGGCKFQLNHHSYHFTPCSQRCLCRR